MSSLAKPEALARISSEIGQVFFASLFVGPLATNSIDSTLLVYGLVLSAIFWTTSIVLSKQ